MAVDLLRDTRAILPSLRYVVNHHGSCRCGGMTEIRKRVCFGPPSAAASRSSRTANSVSRLGGPKPLSVTIGTNEHSVFNSTQDLPTGHELIRSFTNVWRPLHAQQPLLSGQTSSPARYDFRADRQIEVTTQTKEEPEEESSALRAYDSTVQRLGNVLDVEYFFGL